MPVEMRRRDAVSRRHCQKTQRRHCQRGFASPPTTRASSPSLKAQSQLQDECVLSPTSLKAQSQYHTLCRRRLSKDLKPAPREGRTPTSRTLTQRSSLTSLVGLSARLGLEGERAHPLPGVVRVLVFDRTPGATRSPCDSKQACSQENTERLITDAALFEADCQCNQKTRTNRVLSSLPQTNKNKNNTKNTRL